MTAEVEPPGPGRRRPTLATPRIALLPLGPEHTEFVRWLETREENLWHWRYGGQILSPEEQARRLWAGALAQFCVADAHSDQLVGLVTAYNASFRDGTVSLAALGHDGCPAGRMAEATVVFASYCFETWPFRKLYIDTTESNWTQFASLQTFMGGAGTVEGRFREAVWVAGRYEDRLAVTIDRRGWDAARPQIRALADGTPSRAPSPPSATPEVALASVLPRVDQAGERDTIASLGGDSLTLVELRMALEEVGVPAEGIDLESTVGDLRARFQGC